MSLSIHISLLSEEPLISSPPSGDFFKVCLSFEFFFSIFLAVTWIAIELDGDFAIVDTNDLQIIAYGATNMTKKKKPNQIRRTREKTRSERNVPSLHGWQSVATFPSAQIFSLSLCLVVLFFPPFRISVACDALKRAPVSTGNDGRFDLSSNNVILHSQQIVIVILT